jgi:hypothetical protein
MLFARHKLIWTYEPDENKLFFSNSIGPSFLSNEWPNVSMKCRQRILNKYGIDANIDWCYLNDWKYLDSLNITIPDIILKTTDNTIFNNITTTFAIHQCLIMKLPHLLETIITYHTNHKFSEINKLFTHRVLTTHLQHITNPFEVLISDLDINDASKTATELLLNFRKQHAVPVMYHLMKQKFVYTTKLFFGLLFSKQRYLAETAVGDMKNDFWKYQGANMQGLLLMLLRSQLSIIFD